MLGRNGAAAQLRAGLLLLAVLGVVGTVLALAYERHWLSPWQLAPWIVIGIVGVAAAALVVRQTTRTVRLARAVAVLAIVSALLGTWQHIDANLNADPTVDHHGANGGNTAASAPESDLQPAKASDDHHANDKEAKAGDDDHGDDTKSSEGEEEGSADEELTAPSPSFADVVIGTVGHAPVPAALSLAPIGLALGMATIGLGGARRESQE